MQVVAAEGALLERVLDSTHASGGDGLDRRTYGTLERARTKTAWAGRAWRRFALVDGSTLAATAVQADLAGILDGQSVRIFGIGSVRADAEVAGRGHERTLIEALIDRARASQADLVLMCPTPGLDDEACQGFEPIAMAEAVLTVTESPRYGAPMTMVRGGEDRDLAAIAAMGRARAEACRFHLDRDTDFVKHAIAAKRLVAGLGPQGLRQLHFFIAEEGTTAAAYVVLAVEGSRWTLEECGDRDPSGARVGALLQALIAREPAERRPTIRGWLPPGFLPPQVAIAAAEPARVLMVRRPAASAPPLRLSADDVLFWHNDRF